MKVHHFTFDKPPEAPAGEQAAAGRRYLKMSAPPTAAKSVPVR